MECPHCFVRVFPSSDGTCPNCQKNVNDSDAESAFRTTVLVSPRSTFPDFCHLCSIPTESRLKITKWNSTTVYSDSNFEASRILFFVFSLLFLPVGILFRREGGWQHLYDKTVISIPTCDECRNKDMPVVDSIPEKKQLKIIVHKQFADAFAELLEQGCDHSRPGNLVD